VPADGGNGGAGGDVVLRASAAIKSLAHVQRSLRGAAGTAGRLSTFFLFTPSPSLRGPSALLHGQPSSV